MAEDVSSYDIAIVGMACQFPGSKNLQQYWQNLIEGNECITSFTRDELLESGHRPELIDSPDFVPKAPVLQNADCFDIDFWGYSPLEVKYMDPQQRKLLEVSWHAFEDAGYVPEEYEGRVSVYASTAINSYMIQTGLGESFYTDYLPMLLGSDKDFQATRIAFKLGLTGAAVSIQTACSSSLVALHMACQSLISGETDMGLVAASAIRAPLATGHLYEPNSVFTPDGHCKPFDSKANGTIFGSGAAAILIKRLEDALEEGDLVRAVIKGSAINNDGNSKTDFTAPSIIKQAEVISEAMANAETPADSIDYVEAHGTGTFLGDPIEIEALTRAYRLDTDSKQFCGIGSVKSNIGHLDAAAGMASLIKVVLSLENHEIPATINYQSPNPQIPFKSSPFHVISKNQPWNRSEGHHRRAGSHLLVWAERTHT